MVYEGKPNRRQRLWSVLQRKNVLSGLLFIGVAVLGLWVSRNYPIGTALRMGTGYMPRLLLWTLLGLGGIVLVLGLRESDPRTTTEAADGSAWRPVVFVSLSLVVFALAIERLGLVLSVLLLTAIGAVAARDLRPFETVVAAAVLIVLCWLIFIVGLSLTIPTWPEF